MNGLRTETIAAVATPAGRGAVGLIRISGPRSLEAVSSLFASARPKFDGLKPYRLHHGRLTNPEGRVLDEVLVCHMPGPNSYTGEDVVEINCHGSPMVLQGVLEALQSLDIRAAEPGEFTLRAFLNGRMDLTQAEAVAEIINALTPAAALTAQTRLAGNLRDCILALKTTLEELRAQLCLAVDFPEEEAECLSQEALIAGLENARQQVRKLLRSHERTRIWNEGALCVLTGPVNAGKSSLFNAILGRARALVSDTPGTTRDYIEAALSLQGLTVRLVDTAGLRPAMNQVEQAGQALGLEQQARADLLLLVLDASQRLDSQEHGVTLDLPGTKTLVVLNKADLDRAEPDPGQPFQNLGYETLRVSAKTGQGLDGLQGRIRARLTEQAPVPGPDALAPNLRQSLALQRAGAELDSLLGDTAAQVPYDLLGVGLETVCTTLAEITGEIAPSDVLDDIFSRFCIGK